MTIEVLISKSPAQIHADVAAFARRYVDDWNEWLECPTADQPDLFGRLLRRWQATRPLKMRRTKAAAQHAPPFLEDLVAEAAPLLGDIAALDITSIPQRSAAQDVALCELWRIFAKLPVAGVASCVGITKAILLQTRGRIGPALDSRVRGNLGLGAPANGTEWVTILELVSEDIQAFEHKHGSLRKCVPAEHQDLGYGRLYDMLLGPR